MVFEGADGNLVAGLETRLQAVGQQVQRSRGAMGEHDLAGLSDIQPAGDLVAAGFEGLGCPRARQVLGTVDIGRAAAIVMA